MSSHFFAKIRKQWSFSETKALEFELEGCGRVWATSSFRRSNRALRPSHTKLTLPKGALCDASLIPRVGGKTKRKRTPSRERQKFQPSRHRQIVRQPRNNRASLSPETLCAKGPFSHIRGAAGPDRISTWSDSLRGVVSRDLRKGQLCNSREGSAPLCPTESPHTQLEPPNDPSLSLSLSRHRAMKGSRRHKTAPAAADRARAAPARR